ncbi:hypothetical protein AURDEDRAFT_159298 [Auricularia subglabra TFB-10046 SS5]|nr:hypothetical protein AURDEDRAFT_159298 [Auricularia subglabra TFB-10046 SS5]
MTVDSPGVNGGACNNAVNHSVQPQPHPALPPEYRKPVRGITFTPLVHPKPKPDPWAEFLKTMPDLSSFPCPFKRPDGRSCPCVFKARNGFVDHAMSVHPRDGVWVGLWLQALCIVHYTEMEKLINWVESRGVPFPG